MAVMLHHAIGVDTETGFAFGLRFQMRENMHPSRVPPQEKRLVCILRTLHEIERLGSHFLVDRLHAFLGQRAGIRDVPAGETVDDSARTEFFLELGVLRVVGILRLFLCIQVIQVAEELIEPVRGRQHFVAVAEMILAKLAGHVTLCLQQRGDSRVLLGHAFRRAGQTYLGEAGANWRLSGDESGATCGTALLPVPVSENRTLSGNAVDVGRLVAHHSHVVCADVELPDIVAPDDEDIRLFRRLRERAGTQKNSKNTDNHSAPLHT